jgi:pimeloyl-ACP methyl ester carboxylesterase
VWVLLVPGLLSAQQPQVGGYVARRGEVDFARERYRFDGRSLEADVELVGQGVFLETRTAFDSAGGPVDYLVRVRSGAGGPVLQELHAVFADSLRWRAAGAGREQQGVLALRQPVAVIQNLVFSHVAVALRGYHRAARGRQPESAWVPGVASLLPLAVEVAGDTGRVELGGVAFQVRFDSTGWVAELEVPAQGLVVSRRDDVALSPPSRVPRADTLAPAGVHEEPFLIEGGGARVIGTLTLPAVPGPVPVALIVPGSGAVDRNGNAPPALRSNLYAQLAWRLAERGVASLRYDKRGIGASAAGVDLAMTTFDDFAEDVVAGARSLAQDERFRQVVILGHSEGGWLAIRAAARGAPVRGIALLAAPGRPFVDLLRDQLAQQLDSLALARFDSAMALYLRGELPVGLPSYLEPLFRPVNQRFTISIAAYDALAELRRLDLPVLVVQGDRDVQVGLADAQALAGAARQSQFIRLEEANHLFKAAARADRLAQLALYADPTAPVVPALVEAILDWMARIGR